MWPAYANKIDLAKRLNEQPQIVVFMVSLMTTMDMFQNMTPEEIWRKIVAMYSRDG